MDLTVNPVNDDPDNTSPSLPTSSTDILSSRTSHIAYNKDIINIAASEDTSTLSVCTSYSSSLWRSANNEIYEKRFPQFYFSAAENG